MNQKQNIPLTILLLMLLLPLSLKAQLMGNKLSVYAGVSQNRFHGDRHVHDNDFVMPSLFSNFSTHQGLHVKAVYSLHPWLAAGLGLSGLQAGQWEDVVTGSAFLPSTFAGSRISQLSGAVVLRVHTPHQPRGIYNRFRLYLDLAPETGQSVFTLDNPDQPGTLVSESSAFYGFSLSAGLRMSINNLAGIYLEYAWGQNTISGKLFADDRFRQSHLQAGVFIKLAKDPWLIY